MSDVYDIDVYACVISVTPCKVVALNFSNLIPRIAVVYKGLNFIQQSMLMIITSRIRCCIAQQRI